MARTRRRRRAVATVSCTRGACGHLPWPGAIGSALLNFRRPFARRQPSTFPPEYSDLDVEIEPGDRTRQRPKTVERTVGCAAFLYLAAYVENLLFCRGQGRAPRARQDLDHARG
jgi:hypothetical protein